MIIGNHIIVDFVCETSDKLRNMDSADQKISSLIHASAFTILGKTTYQFDSGGYSIVIALSESHFSIHTWPEKALGAIDLFISDYNRSNADLVNQFILELKDYFIPKHWNLQEVKRFEKVKS